MQAEALNMFTKFEEILYYKGIFRIIIDEVQSEIKYSEAPGELTNLLYLESFMSFLNKKLQQMQELYKTGCTQTSQNEILYYPAT